PVQYAEKTRFSSADVDVIHPIHTSHLHRRPLPLASIRFIVSGGDVAVRRPAHLNSKGRRRTDAQLPCLRPSVSTILDLRSRQASDVRSVPCNKFSMPCRAMSAWWQPRFFRCPQLRLGSTQFFCVENGPGSIRSACSTAFQRPSPRSCLTALSPSPPLPPVSVFSASAVCTRLQALWPPPRLRLRLRDGTDAIHAHLISVGLHLEQHCSRYYWLTSRAFERQQHRKAPIGPDL
ncbi:hypothetical protein B0H14DRAFT_3598899, partial [Mycena olivaceomarginata]